jgi:hypothetical protein
MKRIWARWIKWLSLGFVWGVLVGVLFHYMLEAAWPRDYDGRFASDPLKPWFEQLASGKGLCCDFADGFKLDDVDWDNGGPNGAYRVHLLDQWVVVEDNAVITAPNQYGPAVVWPICGPHTPEAPVPSTEKIPIPYTTTICGRRDANNQVIWDAGVSVMSIRCFMPGARV